MEYKRKAERGTHLVRSRSLRFPRIPEDSLRRSTACECHNTCPIEKRVAKTLSSKCKASSCMRYEGQRYVELMWEFFNVFLTKITAEKRSSNYMIKAEGFHPETSESVRFYASNWLVWFYNANKWKNLARKKKSYKSVFGGRICFWVETASLIVWTLLEDSSK